MSLLNGGSGKRAVAEMTDRQYLYDVFLPGITRAEWAIIAQLPPVRDVVALVGIVARIRTAVA